jgi:uroporphyrinogen decarboxylase
MKYFLRGVMRKKTYVWQGNTGIYIASGEWISPQKYKEFVYPCHKRLFDFIHSKTNAKVFLHSCGSIRRDIPYLIEAGVDALNPVQYSAANMGLSELKNTFGKELSFWGGIYKHAE